MTELTGRVLIRFDSDWQCSTGRGRHAGVDAEVARDPDGLPFVPAKTLLGLWRDACERAAHALDDGARDDGAGQWGALVCRLFGQPTGKGTDPDTDGGAVTVRPARLAEPWRARLLDRPGSPPDPEKAMLRRALVTTRFGVAVDQDTGVAADDTLRLVERARAGLGLEAAFHVDDVGADDWAVQLLLHAGARLWHHTGASRRRGAGQCRVELAGDRLTPLENLLAQHRPQVAGFTLAERRRRRVPRLDLDQAEADNPGERRPELTRRAVVTVETLLPVVCGRAVQGNVLKSHPFIPGATLLPVVANALGGAAALIRHGHLVVTDATPMLAAADGTDARAFPTPRSLMSADKGRAWTTGGKVVDATETDDLTDLKAIRQWAAHTPKGWLIGQPASRVDPHASVADETQRPDEAGLFTMEAIPAGVKLQGEVWASAAASDVWESLRRLNGAEATLGRYRRGDYGLVRLVVESPPPTTTPPASTSGATVGADPGPSTLDRFALWLVSDARLADESGVATPTAQALAQELGRLLGGGHEIADGGDVDGAGQGSDRRSAGDHKLTVVRSFLATGRRDSWSQSLGRPLDSRIVVAAGSVVEFACDPPVGARRLNAVLDRGLGGLCAEGFGRAVLLPHADRAVPATAAPAPRAAPTKPGGDPDGWADFRRQAWTEWLARAAVVLASDPNVRRKYIPAAAANASAQLGSLREAARTLAKDNDSVARWLVATRESGEGAKEAKEVWSAAARDNVEKLASPRPTAVAWAKRVRDQIVRADGLAVPDDLGGADPAVVAAALLGECLIHSGREAR